MPSSSSLFYLWFSWLAILAGMVVSVPSFGAQEQRTKARISNAGYTITALPLLAAKEWGFFSANGLDMELILMQSSIVPAALNQGDIDYQAGVYHRNLQVTEQERLSYK